ncbi:hypothetical protein ACFSJM_08700 [Lactococcus formosensis subsp. bovis]|uniref:hypothetical protein n=1 Tax=Lactococcus formosensis TaxID=1281486 RepID=UPI001BCE7496|nr:hypothetical protein [Lactococcus formosensis]
MPKKIVLTDSFFVQVDLGKTNTKEIKKKWKAQKATQLLKRYPYLTFSETEQLFESLYEKEITLDSLSIARLDEKGKPTTENEVGVSYFTLDDEYENLLKVFSEALFNDSRYVSLKFEQKIDYLENSIFPAYQKSTGCDDTHFPLLPEVPEDDFMECPVPFYDPSVNSSSTNETVDEAETTNGELDVVAEESKPEIEENNVIDVDKSVQKNKHENIVTHIDKEQYESQSHDVVEKQVVPKKTLNQNNNEIPQILSLTYFEVQKPKQLEAFDIEYVSNELEKIKLTLNQKIKILDKGLQEEQCKIYMAKKQKLDEEKNLSLSNWIQAHDQRSQLKFKFVAEGQEELKELEEDLVAAKEKEKTFELEEARLAYERKIAEIQNKFQKSIQTGLDELRKETSVRITSRYQSEYLAKTEELQNNLNQEELLIDEKNNQILMDLFQKVKKIVQDKDHNLQKLYQKELEVQSQELGKIHLVALREKKEQDKINSLQNFQEEVKQVKAQNNELEKEIKTSKEIQEKLLSSVESRVPQEGVTEKGLLDQGDKVTGPSSVKNSQYEGIGALIMVATPILAVLGTVSYFFFQTL